METITQMLQALADANWEVRAEAVKTLGKHGNPEAVPALINALNDPRPEVRDEAVCALGNIKDRRAVPALIHTLRNDDDNDVRITAAYILGELGDPSAIEPVKEALLNAIRERDWGMWVAADSALDTLTKTQPITQMLHGINLGADTRLVVPYATPQDNTIVYRAWYGTCQINYYTKDQTITLYDDDNESIHKPIVFLNDQYRKRIVAIFKLHNNNDTPLEQPFLRVEVIHHYSTKHFDAQGPIFITSEHEEPKL